MIEVPSLQLYLYGKLCKTHETRQTKLLTGKFLYKTSLNVDMHHMKKYLQRVYLTHKYSISSQQLHNPV